MVNLSEFDAVIFDFDGTLINSEPYHKKAHSKVLSLILNRGITLSDAQFSKYISKKDSEIFDMYQTDFNVEFDKEKMIATKAEIARGLLLDDNVKIYSYFFDLIKEKDKNNFYIVSNQDEKVLFPVLEKKKIKEYFAKIFCLSKMGVQKDYFYNNIKEFIPNANKVLVFEDDPKVLNYLLDYGFQVVAVKNQMNSEKINNNFENIINTISDV